MFYAGPEFKKPHKRKVTTLFEKGTSAQAAYKPQKSRLSEQQKEQIRRKTQQTIGYNWSKLLLTTGISAGIGYLMVSAITSIFLGYWKFF